MFLMMQIPLQWKVIECINLKKIDFPLLQSIYLGYNALQGNWNDVLLKMRSIIRFLIKINRYAKPSIPGVDGR